MAIKVPPVGQVVTLWQTRSVQAVNEYKTNVGQAGQAWQSAVDESEDDWASGVSIAASNHSYSRNVAGKGSHYTDKAMNLGATRYGPGVQGAGNAYSGAMTKVLGVIANVNLPARGPVGTNDARVSAVSNALHQAKLAGQV